MKFYPDPLNIRRVSIKIFAETRTNAPKYSFIFWAVQLFHTKNCVFTNKEVIAVKSARKQRI